MRARSIFVRFAGPAAAAAALAAILAARAEDGNQVVVCRHAGADGRISTKVDLEDLERKYRAIEKETAKAIAKGAKKAPPLEEKGVSAGLPRARAREERTVDLAETVPALYRGLTLYFVTARADGELPAILPRDLAREAEVFVVEAADLEDVAKLSRTLGRRVSVATAEFARAFGVRARDARVTFTTDGRKAAILEEGP